MMNAWLAWITLSLALVEPVSGQEGIFRHAANDLFAEIHRNEFRNWISSLTDAKIVPVDPAAHVLNNYNRAVESTSPEADTFAVAITNPLTNQIVAVEGTGLNTCICGIQATTGEAACAIVINAGIVVMGVNKYYQLDYYNYNNGATNCNGESTALHSALTPVSYRTTLKSCNGSPSLSVYGNCSITPWNSFLNYPNGLIVFSYGNPTACTDPTMPYFKYNYYSFPSTCGQPVYAPWCATPVGTFNTGNATTYPINTTTYGQTIYQDGGCTQPIATAQYTYNYPCINLHPDDDFTNFKDKATYQIPWNADSYYVVGQYVNPTPSDVTSSSDDDTHVTLRYEEYVILLTSIGVAFIVGICTALGFIWYAKIIQMTPPLASTTV